MLDFDLALLPRSVPHSLHLFFLHPLFLARLAVGRDILHKLAILVKVRPILFVRHTGDTS
jgi:hypothetical protein